MSKVAGTTAPQVSAGLDLEALKRGFAERTATVGVIGLGYVGLPLVKAFNASGFRVTGFDVDRDKVAQLQSGTSYIRTVPSGRSRLLRALHSRDPDRARRRVSLLRARRVVPGDRDRLEALIANDNTPQKHFRRARVVLLAGDGIGTDEIQRRLRVSKPTIRRWRTRYVEAGVDGLCRDKTRSPGKAPLGPARRRWGRRWSIGCSRRR